MNYKEGREKFEEQCRWVEQGNQKLLDRHHARGRLHVTERINMLIDEGSWLEYGQFARSAEEKMRERSPRDGIMTGLGRVNGQAVAVIADDITILGATTSYVNTRKMDRIIHIAMRNHLPIISLSEGGGVRLPDGVGVGFPRLTGLHSINSLGALANPQRRPFFICAVMGYCYGDPAFRAGMADITLMVEDSSVAVSAPMVIETAISEKITDLGLGGPALHQTHTGTVDIVVKTEEECIRTIKQILHILRPPETSKDPSSRLIPNIESLVPSDNKQVYDMRKVIDRICDHGEWIELKPRFGKGLLVGLSRLGGRLTGIIASQPFVAGGSVDAKGLRKSAAFMELAMRCRIPLLVIQDIPGFLIGSAVEKDSMINAIAHHARILDTLDVPMVTLIIRKAYGAAYYFLGMGASGSQYVVAWPNAEISFMSPPVGAAVLTKHVEPQKKIEALQETTKALELGASIWDSVYEFWIDAVILPEETRTVICHAFSFLTDDWGYSNKGTKTLIDFLRNPDG
jgi:acetyl-CoA carboxylase carboxyltransferase component